MQSCMFGGDKANIVSETFDSLCGSYMMCVFVLFIEQSQLPRGETALRVFAQQVGPHQAADSRFWPATGAGLELRAQHTKSTLISIESGVTNQVGGCVWTPLSPQLLPPDQLWLPDLNSTHSPLPSPCSCLIPSSFPSLQFHWLCYCLQSWKSYLDFTLPALFFLFYFFCFYFIFSLSSCGISNHWTSGRGYLHVWRFFFFGVGEGFNSSDLLKGFIIKAKKKEQKKYFSSIT